MSATLEQCQILVTEYHLAEHEFQRALDCMRRYLFYFFLHKLIKLLNYLNKYFFLFLVKDVEGKMRRRILVSVNMRLIVYNYIRFLNYIDLQLEHMEQHRPN